MQYKEIKNHLHTQEAHCHIKFSSPLENCLSNFICHLHCDHSIVTRKKRDNFDPINNNINKAFFPLEDIGYMDETMPLNFVQILNFDPIQRKKVYTLSVTYDATTFLKSRSNILLKDTIYYRFTRYNDTTLSLIPPK